MQGFAAWCKAHRRTLVGLFSGQGINNLARVVAWFQREQSGKRRRRPAEMLSHYADLLSEGTFYWEEAALSERWQTLDDILRDCLLEPLVAKVLLSPPLEGDLSKTRTALLLLAL